MIRPGLLLGAAALCFAVPALAASNTSIQPIHVACPTATAEPLCEALALVLNQSGQAPAVVIDRPAAPGVAALTVHYTPHLQTPQTVAGHLMWIDRAGAAGEGPLLELSVMDADLSGEALAAFAAQLIRLSDLPI